MAVSRRSFLKTTAAATAISATGSAVHAVLAEPAKVASSSSPNKFRGRVAINFNKEAVTDYGTKKVNVDVIKKMVDDTIMLLTGKATVGEAWKEIFPSTLTATSKIAIKTNFYAPNIAPPSECLLAMVEGLRKMDFNGSKFTGTITIFEGNTGNDFVKGGYDTASFTAQDVTLTKASFTNGSDPATGETKYTPILDQCDFLFNVFSARGHETSYTEGFSLGFKSHYGTYATSGSSLSIHSNNAYSQRVRNLQCTGVISKKQVLSVSCAFFCNDEGTPMGSGNPARSSFKTYAQSMDSTATCDSPSTIIMSTDTISCEMQVIKLLRLNKEKTNFGVSDMPKYLRASAGITGALSDKTYDIGEIDGEKMDVGKMINGVVVKPVGTVTPSVGGRSHTTSLEATPLAGQGITHFEFKVPSSLQGVSAVISIHDLKGRLVFSKEMPVRGVRNHFSWNQRTKSGMKAGAGKYIGTLKAGKAGASATFVLR
ncbi:MAG: twin-arginine translocation signal domain-containing protein [Chitinispirillaceae bacterium]|nr:twin-arginine translocation signal domain-containing protein [Chitinispirillaceae bacterium]